MLLNKGLNELEIRNVTFVSVASSSPRHLPVVYPIIVPPTLSIEFINAHVCFAEPAQITHYFYPVSYFERLVLKVLVFFVCWLTVKNGRNSRALGEPSPEGSPPPLSQPGLLQEPHTGSGPCLELT